MKDRNRIESHPRVCNGKPAIKGTRIPVSVILEELEEDDSWDDLLAGYPELRREDIRHYLEIRIPPCIPLPSWEGHVADRDGGGLHRQCC